MDPYAGIYIFHPINGWAAIHNNLAHKVEQHSTNKEHVFWYNGLILDKRLKNKRSL